MPKKRIFQVAKDLNISHLEILKFLKGKGIEVATVNSPLEDDVYETIDTSKEFSGIIIPQNEKNKFFKYLTTPVRGDGSTKRDIDHVESSLQTKLAIDYLMFKGFKLDDVIKNKVKTSKAKDLRSRIQTNESRTRNAKRSSRRNTGFDIEDLDLSVI